MDAAAAALRISAHKSHKTSPWDDDLVERLKLLWADGVSASAIALEFGRGITRNAIIGKVHRLGFTNRVERRANSMPRPARPQKAAAARILRLEAVHCPRDQRSRYPARPTQVLHGACPRRLPLGRRRRGLSRLLLLWCPASAGPAVLPRAPRARLQRQGARLSSPRFHLQALPLANLARGCRMIFRSEEDFDRTLDEFAKARRAWPCISHGQ